jgi:choline dehydrogenase-like flavoprotein
MATSPDSADVLVVGAGSAGAVVAGRLSEDPSTSVTLLEAGADYPSAETIDAIRSTTMSPSLEIDALGDYYWLGLRARRTPQQGYELYWQGRGVGGSSAINGQVALRPPPEDFEAWEKAGCTGWGWDEVLPYFVRLEGDEQFGTEPYHGRRGPLPITRVPVEEWSGFDVAFRDVLLDSGLSWAPDMNAPGATGCGPYPCNSRAGARVSTNDAYLEPARDRSNLTIRPHVLVDRVLFAGQRAVGVRAVGPDGPEDLFAQQVALCAGAVGSAAVLLRSGIGSAADLRALGLNVLADLPVGRGIQDHANVAITFDLDPALPLGVFRPTCGGRFNAIPAGEERDDAFVAACGPFGPREPTGGVTAWLSQPFARGALQLVSRDPTIDPVLDLNLLGDERDRIRFRHILRTQCGYVRALERARVVAGRPKARDGTALADIERMPDRDLDRWVATVVRDVAHLVGSCRMGDRDDDQTVVDPACRVLGIDGLRVIDASVFPFVPRANTNLSVIMLAERMADAGRAE